MEIRTGIGWDVHRFARGRRLVLGGVAISHPRGLAGHSDADVLSHALADAVLGAAGEGDIGVHFPNTDSRWKDVSSLDLLARVAGRVRRRGWDVAHVDATVVAEEPTLQPHLGEMRQRLARALRVKSASVSVKATTAEGMGALGRAEGVAALAVATLVRRRRTSRR